METLKRLIPLVCAAAVLLGVYWWVGNREEIPAKVETTLPTASQPVSKPTTAPTTQPAPTEPTQPPTTDPPSLGTEQWKLQPEYPTYEELFAEDVPYSDYGFDWMTEWDGNYHTYTVDTGRSIRISGTWTDLTYTVPGGEAVLEMYGQLKYMGSDGMYAYLYNIDSWTEEALDTILRIELETGEAEIIAQADRIYGIPALRANCVVYYVRSAEAGAEVCRLYVPEMRLDVLCTLERPDCVFQFTYPNSTMGEIKWYGLSTKIVKKAEALWADPGAKKIINEYDYTDSWETYTQGIDAIHQDALEMFFHHLQTETGIWALEQTVYDPVTGERTKKEGTLDNCWLGSGSSHDHFDPVYEPLPVPKAIMGDWQPAPGYEIQGQLPEAGDDYPYAFSAKPWGAEHKQLFIQYRENQVLLKDADWTVATCSKQAVYCLTEEGILVELSPDGKVCNTLYDPQGGELKNFKYCDGMLVFKQDSKVILLDIAEGQYRVLMDDPEVYIEMWFPGDPRFCFGMTKGLFYQQYLFDIHTGLIEETFIL